MEIAEENKLETLLRLAADEPAYRSEFFECLMESQVFVLDASDENNTQESDGFHIQQWRQGDGPLIIPFFSSLDVLQKSVETEQSYMAFSVRALFEMTLGATLILNPKSDYGKQFSAAEIEQLLSTGSPQVVSQNTVKKGTEILLGQPSIYPSQMVDSLTQLLAKRNNVKKAYLAWIHDTSKDEKPHLIVGIEADGGDIDKLMNEVSSVANDFNAEGEIVDLCLVDKNDSGISQYFINETKPFYEKKWTAKLKSLFGRG